LKLTGKLIKGNKVKNEAVFINEEVEKSFHDLLEEGVIFLCKELDISVPIWFARNTNEFVVYRKTHFNKDQFVENVKFDRFDLSMDKG
jgi:hypothetical protein